MRENRLYGSEGGGAEFNRPCLPLSMRWTDGAIHDYGPFLQPFGLGRTERNRLVSGRS